MLMEPAEEVTAMKIGGLSFTLSVEVVLVVVMVLLFLRRGAMEMG